MTHRAIGQFRVTITPPPSRDAGPAITHHQLSKTFTGDLEGRSTGEMLSTMSPESGAATYVALERFTGTVHGKAGSFILRHGAAMSRGLRELTIVVVPDSGTGALLGIKGRFGIAIVEGQHHYTLDYTLDGTDVMTQGPVVDWEQRYREQPVENMPWFYPQLDPDLEQAIAQLGLARGRLLDLGTGPGTQAIALAKRGFEVTASDLSSTAIGKAERRAAAEGAKVTFVQDDILASRLQGPFDVVVDRGCFHVFPPPQRPTYVQALAQLVRPGGYLLLKTFSVAQPGQMGPFRFAPADIEASFDASFVIESVRDTVYQGTLEPQPRALFSILRRR